MAAPGQDSAQTPVEFPLGVRCAKCRRFILRGARARRGLTGQWRHQSCEQAPAPGRVQFEELAELLMGRQPWPRLVSLTTRLEAIDEELAQIKAVRRAAPIPEQSTGKHVLTPDRIREQELLEQRPAVLAAIDEERAWKAKRLAIEWVDGH
jgi:hypothetical protein